MLGPLALGAQLHRALLREALNKRWNRSWRLESDGNPGEIEQGNQRGHLGPVARGFLCSEAVSQMMKTVTSRDVEPSWSATCFTYYDAPADYMGEHCDKFDACRVAMLVYLQSAWRAGKQPSKGLKLHVFSGDNSGTPLARIVTARSNRIVILNGSERAHFRPALGQGESLTMLAGCFQLKT